MATSAFLWTGACMKRARVLKLVPILEATG
jgi:hypothetical protein